MNEFLDIMDDSFEVYSNFDKPSKDQLKEMGYSDEDIKKIMASKEYKEKGEIPKLRKFDAQKTADTITALGSAGASIYGTVKAFQDPNKVAQRKSLRDACGLKPIAGKGKAKYDDCKKAYESAQKNQTVAPTSDGGFFGGSGDSSEGMSNTTKVVIGVVILSVLGFIGYSVFKGKGATASAQ